jgi:2-keto-4-pentenoate hydratase/2-oxohepta-3-ene-1,7-dioic acid hydratase in catechol pathway
LRFVTFVGKNGAEPGVLIEKKVIGLRAAGFNALLQVIEGGSEALQQVHKFVEDLSPTDLLPLDGVHLVAPIPRPPKIICVGLNYREHAVESNAPIPTVPIIFSKYSRCAIGSGEKIVLPKLSAKPDYEAELGVVIGKAGRYISRDKWQEHVFGYTNFNDVSARDYQMATSQWMIGKTFDTFAPMGPAIVTSDEVGDPHKLAIQLTINGEILQNSNTDEFIFQIPDLLEFLSGVFTLEPGDIIATGTPSGVGYSKTPPRWLQPGDDVRVRIEGLGELRNPVVAEEAF